MSNEIQAKYEHFAAIPWFSEATRGSGATEVWSCPN